MDHTLNSKLVLHKFEELLLNIFASNTHDELTDYFISLCQDQDYHLSQTMEENYGYNLSIPEFAQLCHMSLSSFKRAFKNIYKTTPAAWLKNKRLELALKHLSFSELSISQVAFECGFKDTSHFIRVFKQKHALTPLQYRQKRSRKTA